jgi:hypothetical protein
MLINTPAKIPWKSVLRLTRNDRRFDRATRHKDRVHVQVAAFRFPDGRFGGVYGSIQSRCHG